MERLLPENISSNTTFRDSILIDTLNDIKKSTSYYTSEVQADLVGYDKFDFTMADFKVDHGRTKIYSSRGRYVLNVPKQLIPTAKKENYKKSKFFMKELSISEISDAGKLFTYNFIIFIDGKAYTNLKVVMAEDMTRVILYLNDTNITDGFDPEQFQELVGNNAPVTVFFIPNSMYADYNTNKYVIKKYSEGLPLSRFNMYGETGEKSISYSAISTKKQYGTLLSSEVSVNSGLVHVVPNFERQVADSALDLQIFTLDHFDRTIDIPVGGDYFDLPIRQHVVPLTSFMAFYEDAGFLKFYHNLNIEYHYPNIYRVTGNDVPLKLHVFYYEPSDSVKFVNEMELYYRFFGDKILQKWKDGTISPIIRDYKPNMFPVSIKHLLASQYADEPMNYKVSTMHQFIEDESKTLSVYLMNMLKDRRKMRIYTKNMDLASKIRTNVSQEIPNRDITFNEPRYVFVFAKYFIHEYEMRFFIDGLFYRCDHTYHDSKYYYFYIPTSMITNNTLIEIEKHRSISYSHEVRFDTEIKPVKLQDNPCIASDAIFIDEEGTYLDESAFKFIITEDGKEIEIDSDSNKPLGDNFKIRCTRPNYMNRDMTVWFKRLSTVFEFKVENEDQIDKTLLIGTDVSRYNGHFRIYRNGRLLPPAIYTIKFKKRLGTYTVINIQMNKKVGDVYHIEINPNIYYTNHFSYKISNEGLLDFGGLINKPFNLKWFDVYLNGYKLSEHNFDILTPRYVLINGVSTTDNLLIMEKNWVGDIFKFRHSSEVPIPPIFDHNSCTDDELFAKLGELQDAVDNIKNEIIEDDTIDNVLTDIIEDTSDELVRQLPDIFHYFINIHPYINPDIQYEVQEAPEEIVELIAEKGGILPVFPEGVPHVNVPAVINPDEDKLIDPESLEKNQGIIIH